MLRAAFAFLLWVSVSAAGAAEFQLPDGTKVSGARVERIEGGMAVVEYDGGVTTVPVANLPAALRPRSMPAPTTKRITPVPAAIPAVVKSTPINAAPKAVTTMPASRPTTLPRAAARPDFVIDPLRGVVAIPPPTPPPAPPSANDPRRTVSDQPGRVVVSAEAVPYIERFAEDENNDVMRRYQESLLAKKKLRDEKDAPKDILNLPIYRFSPFRDPNQSAFTSPVIRNDDQFNVPSYLRPDNYINDPYSGKK